MSYEEVERVTTLSAKFKEAIEAKYEGNNALKAKMLKSLKPGEMEELVGKLQDLAGDALQYAFGGKPSEDFMKKNISICDITAELFTRILPAAKVAECVPAELKNDADAKLLTELGAPHLAKLCAPQPK